MGRCTQCRRGQRQDGFTLIELLVVLAVVAGMSVVAYAAFMSGYARVRVAYERDDLERQLLEIPQRVRGSGHGGVLTSRSGDDLREGTIIAVEGVPEASKSIESWQVLRLALPVGWRMDVPKPILYHFSGSCEGGNVVFSMPRLVLRYALAPPLCRPVSRDAGD